MAEYNPRMGSLNVTANWMPHNGPMLERLFVAVFSARVPLDPEDPNNPRSAPNGLFKILNMLAPLLLEFELNSGYACTKTLYSHTMLSHARFLVHSGIADCLEFVRAFTGQTGTRYNAMGALVLFATLNLKRMFTHKPLPANMQEDFLSWFANEYARRPKEELAATETNTFVSFIRAIADRIDSIDPTNNSSGCFNPSNIRFVFNSQSDPRLRGREQLVTFRMKDALRLVSSQYTFRERDVTAAPKDTKGAHNPSDGKGVRMKTYFATLSWNTPGVSGPGFENGQSIP